MARDKSRFVWTIPWALGALLAFCTAGLAETVAVKGTGKAFKYNGAAGSISFTVTGGQPSGQFVVEASTTEDWITINPEYLSQTLLLSSKGVKKGTVKYTVAAYTRSSPTPRTGVIEIAGQQFTVSQKGVACKVALSAPSSSYPAEGDNGLFTVSAPPGCAWNATVDVKAAPWIAIEGSASGEGEGSVAFAVAGNETTKNRTGKVYVTPTGEGVKPSKKTHTVKQLKGAGVGLSLAVSVTGQGGVSPAGGTYPSGTTVTLTATPEAGWQFDHWEGALTGSTNPATVRMDGAKSATAVFVPVVVSTQMHGVAAAGAPIVGHVTIKDSSSPAKEKFTTIAADGQYTIDVSGMTGPFALRADGRVGGREYHLYSAATQADVGGTINVTPFTDLLVANIAGDIAANYFDNGNFSALTKDEIDAKEAALQAKLQPILTAVGLDASIDLLRTAFSADHTKLDGVLDVLQVTVDPATKTADILNIVTQTSVSVDVTTGGYTGNFTQADGTDTKDALTDLQKIVAGFDTFSSLFATGLPAEDDPTLLGLFDATFLEDGIGINQFLSDVTSDPIVVGLQFTNVTVIALDPVAGTGEVGFDVVLQGRVQTDAPNRFKMIRKNGKWLMQGNQHLAKTRIDVKSLYWPGQIPVSMETGLYLQVSDDGNKGIDYAVVTGPGLAPAGVFLVKVIESNDFSIYDGGTFPPPPDRQYQFLNMDGATIDAIPAYGAEYTFALYAANGTLDLNDDTKLDEYKIQIRARPYKPSELSVAKFPTVTAPTLAYLRAFNGGTLDVSWTIPTGCYSDWVFAYLWGPEGSAQEEKQPGPAATSASLIFPLPARTGDGQTITVQSRNLEVSVMDDGGRSLSTHLY